MGTEPKYWTWTEHELAEYFGLVRNSQSRFLKRLDFEPFIFGEASPRQLHETECHRNSFIPVKMEGGKPAIKESVYRLLGGVPFIVMEQAVSHIDQYKPEIVQSMMLIARRGPLEPIDSVAGRLHIDRSTLYRRVKIFLRYVGRYLSAIQYGWPEGTIV